MVVNRIDTSFTLLPFNIKKWYANNNNIGNNKVDISNFYTIISLLMKSGIITLHSSILRQRPFCLLNVSQ